MQILYHSLVVPGKDKKVPLRNVLYLLIECQMITTLQRKTAGSCWRLSTNFFEEIWKISFGSIWMEKVLN